MEKIRNALLILQGPQEQCDARLELINKSNITAESSSENLIQCNTVNGLESHSNMSHQFSLDEQTEDETTDTTNEQSEEEDEMPEKIPSDEHTVITKENAIISSTTIVSNSQSLSNSSFTTNSCLDGMSAWCDSNYESILNDLHTWKVI